MPNHESIHQTSTQYTKPLKKPFGGRNLDAPCGKVDSFSQVGSSITGLAPYNKFGHELAVNDVGTILAASSPYANGSDSQRYIGLEYVYFNMIHLYKIGFRLDKRYIEMQPMINMVLQVYYCKLRGILLRLDHIYMKERRLGHVWDMFRFINMMKMRICAFSLDKI